MEPAQLPGVAPSEFAAGGLLIRLLTSEDWQFEQQLSAVPDVVSWTTIPPDLTGELARKRVDRGLVLGLEGHLARYVIVRDGSPIGTCGVAALDDSVEVFYAVLPEARGCGVATLAASTLAGWARGAGAIEVTLLTFPDNLASQRVAEKAGFAAAGELRRSVKGTEVLLLTWRLA